MITGASAGVGRAVAERFARAGVALGLIARGEERLTSAARSVEALGARALALPLDVADAASVDAAAARVEAELGPIDVWVNNAMATVFAPLTDVSADEYRRATEVTYLGTVWGTMAALRRMMPRDRGTIVQVGSALAYRSIPLQAPYCGAKHAVRGFTESLRTELRHERSRVHARDDGAAAGAQHAPVRLGTGEAATRSAAAAPNFQPELAADAIWHAATHRRRELWVAWPTVKVILAEKVAPGLVDRYLARNAYDGQQTDEPMQPDRPDNLFMSASPATTPRTAASTAEPGGGAPWPG